MRAVWAFVNALDLSELHGRVKAREGAPGQAPPAPELLLALWLYATVGGIGSARQLDRCAISVWPTAGCAGACRQTTICSDLESKRRKGPTLGRLAAALDVPIARIA